jgi:anti-sigma B factor antagonist
MIEINIETFQRVSVVKLMGEIDATASAVIQKQVLPVSLPGCKIILDLSKVAYMSSAGLRMLLSLYRQISGNQGKMMLVGLSDDLKDIMSMTGFLGYFTMQDTLDMGLNVFS